MRATESPSNCHDRHLDHAIHLSEGEFPEHLKDRSKVREEDAKDFNIRFLRILLRIEKYFFSLVLKVTTVLRNRKEGFRLERASNNGD